MRRSLVALATTALVTSALAFAPAVAEEDAGSDQAASQEAEDPAAAAATAERVDVTGGYEQVGDWNNGQQAEVGDALGQDIEAAFIEYGEDTFTFTIDVTSLPAAGGVPEFTRYGWSFNYNDAEFELDGKFTNYSRGACDPTAGNCPPPRDPGIGYFALRGNCVTNEGNVTTCEELGGVNATFDPGDGTITIPVPADQLAPEGVHACDSITGASSFLGQSVWAAPTAFVTSSAFPNDQALHFQPLVVPHAEDALTC